MKFKSYIEVQVLINSGSKVNTITPAYVIVLKLCVCSTDIGIQKIDEFTLLTYGIMLANFQLKDK